jgi:hypothetical protein
MPLVKGSRPTLQSAAAREWPVPDLPLLIDRWPVTCCQRLAVASGHRHLERVSGRRCRVQLGQEWSLVYWDFATYWLTAGPAIQRDWLSPAMAQCHLERVTLTPSALTDRSPWLTTFD